MKELPWFRFYIETINDPKFAYAAEKLGYSRTLIIGLWTMLLAIASKSPMRGKLLITPLIPYDIDNLAKACDEVDVIVNEIIKVFIDLDMIEYVNNCYEIKNWNSRQYEGDNSAERVRNWRNKKRYSNVTVTAEDNRLTDTESYTDNKDDEVFAKFQNNICFLTPIIAEKLADDIKEYSKDWVLEAIDTTAKNGGRNYQYLHACLVNRKNGVHKPSKNGRDRVSVGARDRYGEWEK
jgi:DnaD/phage-associated family protein